MFLHNSSALSLSRPTLLAKMLELVCFLKVRIFTYMFKNKFCSKCNQENNEKYIKTWRTVHFIMSRNSSLVYCLLKECVGDTGLYLCYVNFTLQDDNMLLQILAKFDLSFLSSRNCSGPIPTKIKLIKQHSNLKSIKIQSWNTGTAKLTIVIKFIKTMQKKNTG
jgi:hypothetical protein